MRTDPAQRLTIRVLGELELRLGGTALPALDSARAEALLAYLVLHRDAPLPRQRVAFALWPDSSEAQARTNLRHLLHTLRRLLPEVERFLDITPRTLRWKQDAPLEIDVAAFEAALAREAEEGETALREAAEAYTGDLLQGHYEDWILAERERLRARYLDTLARLAARLAERGANAEAIAWAERLAASDPLREDAYRLLMRLYDATGESARALRTYHACSEALERELGAEPSAETRALYEELVSSRAPAAPDARAFVGRIGERARLADIWSTAEGGRAQLLLVTGEAGVGKTRLVEELRAWCERRGAATAEARSYPAEGALAYAPVVAWLRSAPIAARVRNLGEGRRGELARLLPELGERPRVALPAAEQRRRLFDSLVGAVTAPGPPLLLIADDVHWADAESLQFLHYLLGRRPQARLLVAATARREELDDPHPLTELIAGLTARGQCEELALGRLSRHETRLLAERIAGRRIDGAAAVELFERTEGNPLFVVEALRAGSEGGAPPLTPRVQAVIEARLARLSPPARELAGVAATVGREFSIDVIADAGELDETTFVSALDELWRRRIVRRRGDDGYDFTHGRIREIAYGRLSPARRRHTHRLVARALERVHPELEAVSAELAAHHEQGGDTEAAIGWYRRAAEVAVARHADADAVAHLRRAIALLRTRPAGRARDERELELVMASLAPAGTAGGYGSAQLDALQRRGLELAAAVDAEPDPAVLRSVAIGAYARGDFERSRAFARELRARGERAKDEVLLVESDYVLGISAFWDGRLRDARRHFEAAVERYDPGRRATHLVHFGMDPRVVCMSRLGNALWFLGHPAEAVRARDTALALAGEIDHPATGSTARWFAIMLDLELGDWDALRGHGADLSGRPEELEVKPVQANVRALAGFLDVLDGRARGLGRIRAVVDDLAAGDHAPGHRACITRVLMEACRIADEPAGRLEAAELLLRGGAGAPLWRAEALRVRAASRVALGASADAVAADLDEALAVARRQGARALEERVRRTRGTLAERTPVHAPGP